MLLLITVVKKDGSIEPYNTAKIQDAILASARKIISDMDEYQMKQKSLEVANEITRKIYSNVAIRGELHTSIIHNIVLSTLATEWPIVGDSYAMYRNYRKQMADTFENTYEASTKILVDGDKENANKDSNLNSTKQALIANASMRSFMSSFELDKNWVTAHKEGWIHIHDLAERYLRQKNCCLFNMAGLLKDGFELNGTYYAEPNYFDSAINVIGDTTLFASAQQLGGFTISELDTVLAPYAEKSYQFYLKDIQKNLPMLTESQTKEEAERRVKRDLLQGFQGFETKLNTISNSLGQIPFVTVTFGLDTSYWGREISKAMLEVRIKGIGEKRSTAVFPKLSFLYRDEINGLPDSPNYDIKKLAIKCSTKRLYPDYLSLSAGHLKEVFDRCGKAVSGMGFVK